MASFHGMPQKYIDKGDPYQAQCIATTDALRKRMGLDASKLMLTFQSRFGFDQWLQPYTDKTIEQLAKDGVRRIAVVTPGFLRRLPGDAGGDRAGKRRDLQAQWRRAICRDPLPQRQRARHGRHPPTGAARTSRLALIQDSCIDACASPTAFSLSYILRPALATNVWVRRTATRGSVCRHGELAFRRVSCSAIGGFHGRFDIFAIALVLLVIFTLFAGVKTVPQGYDWTIERFGKYTRTLAPGLNLIIPYFDRVGRKMNMMEQVINIPEQEVITKDNATVTVDGVAFFQVFDAAKASYEVSNLNQAIIVLTMTNIRSVMGAMDLDQVLSHRDEINERLLRVVDAAVSPWGLKVNRIEIKDIVPPADLVEAMGRQMKAERVKRADILQAEGQRQSEILRAEGAKQGQILQAEGRREAAFRDAEARERSAEAEAKATQMVSEAIAKGDVAALNYFIADKYIKAFGQLADSPNQKIIMLPIEAMSILGSLAGIGEIAKATFGESAASAQAAARRPSVPTTVPPVPPPG